MEHSSPSAAVNHSHALLNALRAAISGEQSRILTRQLLKLPGDLRLPSPKMQGVSLEYVEQLFKSFSHKETLIVCFEQPGSEIVASFQEQIRDLHDRSESVRKHLQVLASREGDFEQAARELTSYYVGHFRSRESYIHGLIHYAETYSLWDMKRHWEEHLQNTLDLIDDSRDLLITVAQSKALSSYLIQRIYDSCVLIPASLKCQAHDMRHILSLDQDHFSFEHAEIFTEQAQQAWLEMGLNAEQAGYWASYEITPTECAEWIAFGFIEPRTAGAWKVRGFDPEIANLWAAHGFDASEAYLCRHGGISTPEDAERMRQQVH